MDINQISQLIQSTTSQANTNTTNNTDNNAFELLLQEMLQNSGSQDTNNSLGLSSNSSLTGTDLTNSINAASNTGVDNKTTNSLDSLSLNPQKMAQMLEIMQMASSSSVMANFGSDDTSSTDSDSDSNSDGLEAVGNSNPMGGKNDITQLLQTLMQNQGTTSSNSNTTNNLNAQTLQTLANLK